MNLHRPDAKTLLMAYANGAFPMADGPRGRIAWYAPDPRGVLPLECFHIPASLARLVRQGRFEIRIDSDVPAVFDACAGARAASRSGFRSASDADPNDANESPDDNPNVNPTWMSPALRAGYLDLHRHGHVHSVEAWRDGVLVGGLYGVRLRGAFFGESMFVRPDLGGSNSSKVCLVHLVQRLRAGGFTLLDTQMVTSHMRQFGAVEIARAEYERRLELAMEADGRWERSEPRSEAQGEEGTAGDSHRPRG